MQGFETGRRNALTRARQDALSQYAAAPSMDALAPLAAVDPDTYATLSTNERQRAVAARQTQDALRKDQARAMVPDVLAGLSLGGTRSTAPDPAAAGQDGDVVVTAPVKHKTVADLYQLDPELASTLVPRIGDLQEQHRKQLAYEADTFAAAAFAARQVPLEKRRGVIDQFRRQLKGAGFSDDEIDGFDPTDEALGAAITHSLGIKSALSQHLDEQKFAWQQRDDQIDNARDDRRVAITDRAQRDTSARGWSADRRSERRYQRGDGANIASLSTDDLLNMLGTQ
ncbi:hypothetical protein KZ813_17840 [Sphingomonas sp. RHCKR7]|uniref:hypothetical protein n=1 Tax=Sphingomonas folli TaxID=2862497 RepID=UPI001CA5BBF4|nr:hypothetical protein [Sphingomonas folli]MBW6528707.1 hypothetical protein [Sphingomonas folli]